MSGDRLGFAARAGTGLLALGAMLFVSGAAFADDCNQDIGNLTKKRIAIIEQLNHLAKNGKGQLDATTSCPKLRSLVGSERDLLNYLTKNKDWCSVPDAALDNISASLKKSTGIASQACRIAVQMKKQQELQAAGGGLNAPQGQKLPTGPL